MSRHSLCALHNREVDAVVHTAVLGDRGEHRLVVRCGIDREEAVGARHEALGDAGSNEAVAVRGGVDALEERELGRVRGLGLVERGEGLDDNVGVADDDTGVIDLGRGGVVVGLGVREEAELHNEAGLVGRTILNSHSITHLHVLNLQLDGEGFIRLDSAEVPREGKLSAGDFRLGDDAAHRDNVTRAPADLLAISQGNVLGQAEVGEVVLRGQ
jgi:hypothetical protein